VSINIKNKEADRLLAEFKSATGKGASELVLDLLRKESARFARERRPPAERASGFSLRPARCSGCGANRP
jgi:hypothetical protein